MRPARLILALAVVLALSAAAASSALAAASTTVEAWRTGSGGGTVLSGSQAVTTTGTGEFVSEVGTTPVKIRWSGVNCVSCTIFNEGGGAKGEGKLEFTSPVMVTPVCTIATPITTSVLKMDWTYMIGTAGYTQFTPASGATVFTFTVTNPPSCPIPVGTYKVTGSFFAKQVNVTGTYATTQEVTSSGPINETAGGGLQFGSKIAELNGLIGFKATTGVAFGVE